MVSQPNAAQESSNPFNDPEGVLAARIRSVASRAAELAGGGQALIFVETGGDAGPEQPPHLRAAAGFASPDAARRAATELQPCVAGALHATQPRSAGAVASLGERGAAGLWIAPLHWEQRRFGVLVVAHPAPLETNVCTALADLANHTSLQLDHHLLGTLLREMGTARPEDPEKEPSEGEGSDEILKLSEALFAQDIELLRNTEQLGKVEKLKSDFIEKMSRELRTPLNSIIESIISVLAGENESLSDGAKQCLRDALDEGTSFLRTLQNILDLWRIRQGELPVELQEVNFREVVEESIFSVQDTLAGKPVVIEKCIEEPLPNVQTDLAKVNQILFLLLDNAVKFTPEGRIEITVRVQDDRLLCEIKDTGIGICPDDRQFIFDEFYQVDELSSNRYRGSGLGLSLVQELLGLLDGEISVSSDVGRGSRFTFEVPVQQIF